MNKNIAQVGSPIETFIQQAKDETKKGLGSDWELKSPIEFELSTFANVEGGGKLNIGIITLGANVDAKEVQKIKLSIGPKDEALEAEKLVRIAEAKGKEIAYLNRLDTLERNHSSIIEKYKNKKDVQ